jgi:putative endonuclease
MRGGRVTIMTNRPNDILDTGVTSDIGRRAYEHRESLVKDLPSAMVSSASCTGSSTKPLRAAILRESNMRHWPRAWKAQLIVNSNPGWLDLFETLNQ